MQQGFLDSKLGVTGGQKRSQPLAGRVASEIGEALSIDAALEAEQGIALLDPAPHQRQRENSKHANKSPDQVPHPRRIPPKALTSLADSYNICTTGGNAMVTLKVRKVGNSLGVTLSSEVAQTLRVREGDHLYLTETPGGFRLTPYAPDFEETMEIAERFMRRYRNALRDLAK